MKKKVAVSQKKILPRPRTRSGDDELVTKGMLKDILARTFEKEFAAFEKKMDLKIEQKIGRKIDALAEVLVEELQLIRDEIARINKTLEYLSKNDKAQDSKIDDLDGRVRDLEIA